MKALAVALALFWYAAPSHAVQCLIYGALVPKELGEATLEKQGFEVLEVPEFSQADAQATLAILIKHRSSMAGGAGWVDGRVKIPNEYRKDPADNAVLDRFEAYLNALYDAGRNRLLSIPNNKYKHDGARIQIRWSAEGLANPTSTDKGHKDGGFGTLVSALVGPSTVVQPTNLTEIAPPTGTPVLMIGLMGNQVWGLPPGWHRAPSNEGKSARLFIQIVY